MTKSSGSPQPTNPLSQNPVTLTNPMALQGPTPLAPVSGALPNASMPGQPPGVLGGPPPPPGQNPAAGAAQMAGGNAQAAMQAAMAGRPVAPQIATGGGGIGPSGGGGLQQLVKGMDPSTVASIMKLLG